MGKNTREVILESAAKLLARHGYRRVTLKDVAEEVGIKDAGIFYYFKNKKELFREAVKKDGEEILKEIKGMLNEIEDPVEAIKKLPEIMLNTIEKHLSHRGVTSSALESSLEFVRDVMAVFEKEEVNMLRQLFLKGVDRGIFQVEEIDLLSIAIITALNEIAIRYLISKRSKKIKKGMLTLSKYLLEGIMKK